MLLTEPGERLAPTMPAQSSSSLLVAGTSLIHNHALELNDAQNGQHGGYIINMTIEGRCRIFDGAA